MNRKKVVKVIEKPMLDGTNLQYSVCAYQNYPWMGRFCEPGVRLWLDWEADKND